MRAALGVDGDAGGAERLDVAMDGPDRDLQLLCELRGGHAATRLEEQQQREQAGRTHGAMVQKPDRIRQEFFVVNRRTVRSCHAGLGRLPRAGASIIE